MSYEQFCMKTRFETESKGNSEKAYCLVNSYKVSAFYSFYVLMQQARVFFFAAARDLMPVALFSLYNYLAHVENSFCI